MQDGNSHEGPGQREPLASANGAYQPPKASTSSKMPEEMAWDLTIGFRRAVCAFEKAGRASQEDCPLYQRTIPAHLRRSDGFMCASKSTDQYTKRKTVYLIKKG